MSNHVARPDAATRAGFLNLSNHPVATWSDAQREAAAALGFGAPVDLTTPMPEVPADADTDAVSALADTLATRVRALGVGAAFVAGEFSLTHALVSRLQSDGVRCFTSTTRREAVARPLPDGRVEMQHTFSFVRWREYPR